MTYITRLGPVLGAVALAGHAVPAGWYAKTVLSLPMEAGGLVIGPIVGLPVLGYALVAVCVAAMLLFAPDQARGPGIQALLLTALVDLLAVFTGVHDVRLLLGAALAWVALLLLAWGAVPRVRDWG